MSLKKKFIKFEIINFTYKNVKQYQNAFKIPGLNFFCKFWLSGMLVTK